MQLHYKRLPSNECWALCVFVCFSIELDFLFYVCKLIILNVVNRLAKILLKTLGLTAVSSAAEAGIQKKNVWFQDNDISNIKWRNGKYFENSQVPQRLQFINKSCWSKNWQLVKGTKMQIYWYVISYFKCNFIRNNVSNESRSNSNKSKTSASWNKSKRR